LRGNQRQRTRIALAACVISTAINITNGYCLPSDLPEWVADRYNPLATSLGLSSCLSSNNLCVELRSGQDDECSQIEPEQQSHRCAEHTIGVVQLRASPQNNSFLWMNLRFCNLN